jgi:sialate O-acetylesterase
MKRCFSLLILFLINVTAFGQVRMARLFTDHVVLQRQQPIPVWGWAKAGEAVKVTLAGQTQQAKADASGKWLVRFAPLEAGGPHTLAALAKSGSATAGRIWSLR